MFRTFLNDLIAKPALRLLRSGVPIVLGCCTLAVSGAAKGAPYEIKAEDLDTTKVYSPYVGRAYPNRVLFGDTHFHTSLSFDAGLVGTTLGPEEAYRFARGEKVISNTGQAVQLVRPFDFLVVTDHAELIGLALMLRESSPILLADPWGKWLHERFNSGLEGRQEGFASIIEAGTKGENPFSSDDAVYSIWQDYLETAERFNEPGRFSAIAGFEWTSTPDGDNLHRVVVFADDIDKTSRTLPFSTFDSSDPEELWKYLAAYEDETGGRVLAIPHNGNLSNGMMFRDRTLKGDPIDREYAETRMRWEPVIETTQMKGDGETHPLLSPEDEFADYETWDVSNLDGSEAKSDEMLKYEYARSALKLGLKLGLELKVNPFKFGLGAGTDTHTGLATTREENFFGKYASSEPSDDRFDHEVIPASDPSLRILSAQEVASGLMAVWARENTRSDVYEAIKRREVYATTGTRIRVRVFGGWDFEAEDASRPDFAEHGYERGTPMGGDLSQRRGAGAPRFLIRALRDPDGANLDRLQVIKGWVDADGETHERIYDVACSDGRAITEGRCDGPVESTVDVATATYTNTIGAPFLAAHWEDPDFSPQAPAFYYVRVLEIPTPRWTTYDAAYFGIERPEFVPATTQDRAYTSPIWYSP